MEEVNSDLRVSTGSPGEKNMQCPSDTGQVRSSFSGKMVS